MTSKTFPQILNEVLQAHKENYLKMPVIAYDENGKAYLKDV